MSTTAATPHRLAEARLVTDRVSVRFRTRHGVVPALSQVSFDIGAGSVRSIIGESGSGKSVLAHALLGLLPRNVDITGSARLDDHELIGTDPDTLRHQRARHIAFVPQSPATSLNPVRRIGSLLTETARAKGVPADEIDDRIATALTDLDLPVERTLRSYAHQLSGGMQQRVLLAAAMLARPTLVIADEPTSALDADRVADTANGLDRLAAAGAAVLVITHDLRLAQRLGGRVGVLYAGHLVEDRTTDAFFAQPSHPYAAGLLNAMPEHGGRPIPGQPPQLTRLPEGCPFEPRCNHRAPECTSGVPQPLDVDHGTVRCLPHAQR